MVLGIWLTRPHSTPLYTIAYILNVKKKSLVYRGVNMGRPPSPLYPHTTNSHNSHIVTIYRTRTGQSDTKLQEQQDSTSSSKWV